jgi:NAD(P)H dehydrogenase (quinone)
MSKYLITGATGGLGSQVVDLAEGAAAVLFCEGHERKIYALGGREAVNMSDIAAAISDASGRKIDYRDTPVAES